MIQTFKDIHPAYTLIEETRIEEVRSSAALLVHNKTGARVAILSNEDPNKVFSIAFRTPPKDSTGVPHIIEHSVLSGSRSFPVKDPFVELVKGSLNTFLNAITFPDKTMYPVASCNPTDFRNLMHVYLDSVFYPNIYRHKEIFLQEGWHYEVDDDDTLTINGVVYNEMKGAFSAPESVLSRKVFESLFPDTPYGVESGGDPAFIPDLTYEQFLDFHRTYYHPSNSYIFLYGDMNPAEDLDFIHESYLKDFDMLKVDSAIPLQKSFEQMTVEDHAYGVGSEEELDENTYLALSYVLPPCPSTKDAIGFSVLDYALMSSPGAPLKQALIEAGLGKDVYADYERSLLQPYYSFVAKNADPDDQERMLSIITETLKAIADQGIERDALEAALHTLEFRFREGDYGNFPAGLIHCIRMMDSWLYDESRPFDYLRCFDAFNELRDAIGTGYYENLIRTCFLENPHASMLMLHPEVGLTQKQEKDLHDMLDEKAKDFGPDKIAQIRQELSDLRTYQETPSSQEALESIPMLSLSDINPKAQPLKNQTVDFGGVRGLWHDYDARDIVYMSLIFDITGLPEHLLPYAGLLPLVLANVDTEKGSYQQLNHRINKTTGGIAAALSLYRKTPDIFTPTFEISGKAMRIHVPEMIGLISEILFESKTDDPKRLLEIINEAVSRIRIGFYTSGHSLAILKASAHISPAGRWQEATGGLTFYRFLEGLAGDWENRVQDVCLHLTETLTWILTRSRLMTDVTGDTNGLETVQKTLPSLTELLPDEARPADMPAFSAQPSREALIIPGTVQYAGMTGNFVKAGHAYHGALNVLNVILGLDYLWQHIRVKGGAYGCMNRYARTGEAAFVSYRDPHLASTLDVFRGCADYLKTFDVSDRDMLKYIIGAIGSQDVPRSPFANGQRDLNAFMSGVTEEDLQISRTQILEADVNTIRGFAPLIDSFVSEENICVVGSESKIRSGEALFDHVETL